MVKNLKSMTSEGKMEKLKLLSQQKRKLRGDPTKFTYARKVLTGKMTINSSLFSQGIEQGVMALNCNKGL